MVRLKDMLQLLGDEEIDLCKQRNNSIRIMALKIKARNLLHLNDKVLEKQVICVKYKRKRLSVIIDDREGKND